MSLALALQMFWGILQGDSGKGTPRQSETILGNLSKIPWRRNRDILVEKRSHVIFSILTFPFSLQTSDDSLTTFHGKKLQK